MKLILAIVLGLSLTACGDDTVTKKPDAGNKIEASVKKEASVMKEASVQKEAAAPDAATTVQ